MSKSSADDHFFTLLSSLHQNKSLTEQKKQIVDFITTYVAKTCAANSYNMSTQNLITLVSTAKDYDLGLITFHQTENPFLRFAKEHYIKSPTPQNPSEANIIIFLRDNSEGIPDLDFDFDDNDSDNDSDSNSDTLSECSLCGSNKILKFLDLASYEIDIAYGLGEPSWIRLEEVTHTTTTGNSGHPDSFFDAE